MLKHIKEFYYDTISSIRNDNTYKCSIHTDIFDFNISMHSITSHSLFHLQTYHNDIISSYITASKLLINLFKIYLCTEVLQPS